LRIENRNSNGIAIRCEGLSKEYRIGEQERYKALRDVITDAATAPFRRLRSGRRNGNATLPSAVSPLSAAGSSLDTHRSSRTNTIWALNDVSFEIKRGEVVGIIGSNGAGKSTLLKILSRITKPTRGHAEIHGRVGSLLEVGTGFHPELTGRENIYLNGAILGMRKAEIDRKFHEMVSFAEIEKFIDTPVKRYSSGMYVRLAFAVAAHMDTEILLVDEVLAVGDAGFQKRCLGKMGQIAKEDGRTVFFVSHNVQAIKSLCSVGLLMDRGHASPLGEPADLIGHYMSEVNRPAGDQFLGGAEQALRQGNGIVLQHVSVCSEAESDELIDLETPLRIEIEYSNLVPHRKIVVNLSLYSVDGTEVFEDWTAEEPNWGGRTFPEGLFRTLCRIPGNLLNEGSFSARIVFFEAESTRHLYDLRDAVIFSVADLRKRPIAWHGRFAGLVHPKLTWETHLLGALES
jgi:lipopolysaccharide transport system ATP-binding protein